MHIDFGASSRPAAAVSAMERHRKAQAVLNRSSPCRQLVVQPSCYYTKNFNHNRYSIEYYPLSHTHSSAAKVYKLKPMSCKLKPKIHKGSFDGYARASSGTRDLLCNGNPRWRRGPDRATRMVARCNDYACKDAHSLRSLLSCGGLKQVDRNVIEVLLCYKKMPVGGFNRCIFIA